MEMSIHANVAAVGAQACRGTPAVKLPLDRDVRRLTPQAVMPTRAGVPRPISASIGLQSPRCVQSGSCRDAWSQRSGALWTERCES